MRVRRVLAGVALLACASAGLAGCSDDADADPEPKISSPETTAATAETETADPDAPVEPTPPAAMERDDEEGAKAFVEYYWEVVGYAQSTGDVGLLESLDMPACESCRNLRARIDEIYAKGGQILGGTPTAQVARVVASGAKGVDEILGYHIEMTLVAPPGKVVNRKGRVTSRTRGGTEELSVTVSNNPPDGWAVAYWEAKS